MSQKNRPVMPVQKIKSSLLSFVISAAFLVASLNTSAQISNKGREFWVSYPLNYYFENGNSQQMVLYLSAEQNATVTITSRVNGVDWVRTYTVPAGTVKASDFIPKTAPNDARLFDYNPPFGNGVEAIHNKAIHVESTTPIVVYAHYIGGATSGAAMLFPVEAYGYNYTTLNNKQFYSVASYTYFYIMAAHDNTTIEVIPSIATRNRPANVPYTVTLNKFQSYQVVAQSATGDLTGSKIRSIANASGECKPIAVFSGSSRTSLGCTNNGSGGDFIMQQNFPSQAWGKRYLTAPTSNSGSASALISNIYRVLVKEPGTVVTLNGSPMPGFNGIYYEFHSTRAEYIESNKPIMVAQYIPSSGSAGCPVNGTLGDPEMIYISPIEQAIKRVGFYRNTREAITVNYLTLIIPEAGVASLRIDGSNVFDYVYTHHNDPRYKVVVKRWNAAQAQCIVSSDSAFNAITYGLGSVESYGYNAGTLINNLNVITQIQNTPDPSRPSHVFTCRNTPINIAMLVAYKPTKILWDLSQVPVISPNVDYLDNAPDPSDSILKDGTWYYEYNLPGNYAFSDTGTFLIPVLNTHAGVDNCNNTEEVKLSITVKPNPVADFTFSHTGCRLDTVRFASAANTGNGYTVNKWNWEFPDGSVSDQANVAKLFTTDGVQNIKLRVTSTEGCIGDTIRPITIFAPPVANLTANNNAICEGSSVTFTSSASYSGTAPINHHYWDLTSASSSTVNNPSATATFNTYGPKVVKYVAGVSPTCISDTLVKIVNVAAKPVIGFTYPAGCLPVDGIVQFNNTSTSPDGQTLSYEWEFGDQNATTANPNTSTAASPTHFYATGNYNIKLKVTTANGCVKDTTVAATFNVRPLLAYAPIPAVCESQAGTTSIASASVTNSVPGTGVYRGPATTAAGLFNPSVAGAGTHTIWYVYSANGGCIDSISQTIRVNAKPAASFTYPSGGCLPVSGLAQFNNTTTISDGQTVTYNWDFGDPNATAANPNNSTAQNPTHNYSNFGNYTIKLTAMSANGCTDDTTITTAFSVKPAISFPALASSCTSGGTVSIAQAVVTNGVTGTGIYRGPGTSANGNFNPAVAGEGTHTIWYVFTSAGNCVDSISSAVKVHPKPVANFTVNNNICLDGQATFTPSTPISGAEVVTWNWDFGDNNTASYTNDNAFTRSYSAAGNYSVKLVTVSDSGCLSDVFTRALGVRPLPVANFTMPAAVCMPNGAATFSSTSTVSDNTALTTIFNLGDNTVASTPNVNHVYTTAGSYNVQLTVTTPFGCTHDTVKVFDKFFDKPVASFSVSPDTLCQGTDNVFSDLSVAPNSTIASWMWNFDDGTQENAQNPLKRYKNPGNYDVQLVVTNAVGCASDPFTKEVIVYLQPVIDAGPSFVVPQGTLITFRPRANDSVNLNLMWTPASDFADPSKLTQSLVANRDQTYTLTAVGQGNCSATDVMTVKILKPVHIPNAFSPNADGINDSWNIPNLVDYPGATIEVFNRYGQKVYYSSGYSRPWDGTMNGKPLPLATYYYVIVLKNGFEPITGSITIIK
jgi:gliding motility-associated-like protein